MTHTTCKTCQRTFKTLKFAEQVHDINFYHIFQRQVTKKQGKQN